MIRLALVGCGGIARAHAQRLQSFAPRMQVVAAVDVDEAVARRAAQTTGAPRVANDVGEVLDEVDAVLLALPHHLHHAIGLQCLEAGKHVLMEKPLANSEAECLDLIAAAEKQGVTLMVAYCMRYHPIVRRVKELLDARTYGEVFHVAMWTEQLTRREPDSWMHRAKYLGGGQFFSHGCHYIDLLLWLLGEPVSGTHIGTNLGTPWMEWEGTSDATIRFQSGAIGYHMGTWGARGTSLKNAMHFHCTEAMLEMTPDRNRLVLHRGAREEEKGGSEVLMEVDGGKHLANEMEHFLDSVESGREPLTGARASLQSLRVIWSLYDAERAGIVANLRGLGLAGA
jgi:predicted dehydrogenase